MNKESFSKNVQNKLWPTDREPPLWSIWIIIILLAGLILWLFGMPWQTDIPFTLFLLLLALGGQQLGKRIRKDSEIFKDPDEAYSHKVAVGWALGAICNIILVVYAVFCYIYAWPLWTLFIPAILLGLVAGLYFYLKRPKKVNKQKQPDEQNTPITKSKL